MKTFNELDLIEPLQRALSEENYDTPTAIQAQTIPAALQGFDILGCAQTGTGKTAAFALPILDELGRNNPRAIPNQPFVLVLAPTRELAIQIGASFETYGQNLKLRKALVFGGVNQHSQVKSLNRGAHILVATPGRLLDLMNQGHIDLQRLETFVLDEADRMLDMGFLPDLKRIIRCLPDDRQSLFFSATLPQKIVQLSESLLVDPVSVNVTPKSKSVDKISQQVLLVGRGQKQSLLQEILGGDDVQRVIVFTRTKRTANILEKKLKQSGANVAAIHGNKSQHARTRVLDAFRRDRVQVLVATDVAARGIDVDGITHVINFDLPTDPESYIHRIGRTGRAGADGIAITFCTSDQRNELRAIERLIGIKLPIANDQKEPQAMERRRPPTKSRRQPTVTSNRAGSSGEAPGRKRKSRQQQRNRRKPAVAR